MNNNQSEFKATTHFSLVLVFSFFHLIPVSKAGWKECRQIVFVFIFHRFSLFCFEFSIGVNFSFFRSLPKCSNKIYIKYIAFDMLSVSISLSLSLLLDSCCVRESVNVSDRVCMCLCVSVMIFFFVALSATF